MLELGELLDRPGLAPDDRLLIAAKAAIWPAAWGRLAECVATLRDRGEARSRIEETLLQAVLFYGFPRTISAFEVLERTWPVDESPSGGALPDTEQAAAGRELFAAIYGKNTDSVSAMLRRFHADFHDFVLEAAYGRILARPALPGSRRELLAVGALAVMAQVPQLVAHGRGAVALGATADEVREAIFTATMDEERTREFARRLRL